MNSDARWIAERQLEYLGAPAGQRGKVTARIGNPEHDPQPGGGWRCAAQVFGASDEDVFYAYGVDAIQALQLALTALGIRLRAIATDGGILTWKGQTDLGFPIVERILGWDSIDEDGETRSVHLRLDASEAARLRDAAQNARETGNSGR